MAAPKQLVLFVEGPGDMAAAPLLVRQLLSECDASDCLVLHPKPYKVGKVAQLIRAQSLNFERKLAAARKERHFGGVLVLLDGDVPLPDSEAFCARNLGHELSEIARRQGAGATFSFASVFAMQEYESWLIGGIEALAGIALPPDNRPGILAEATAPDGDIEVAPRGAKAWLKQHMKSQTYKETTHQEPLTRLLVRNLEPLRLRGMRSFKRLESAVHELVTAIRSGQHIVTPIPSPPITPPQTSP